MHIVSLATPMQLSAATCVCSRALCARTRNQGGLCECTCMQASKPGTPHCAPTHLLPRALGPARQEAHQEHAHQQHVRHARRVLDGLAAACRVVRDLLHCSGCPRQRGVQGQQRQAEGQGGGWALEGPLWAGGVLLLLWRSGGSGSGTGMAAAVSAAAAVATVAAVAATVCTLLLLLPGRDGESPSCVCASGTNRVLLNARVERSSLAGTGGDGWPLSRVCAWREANASPDAGRNSNAPVAACTQVP